MIILLERLKGIRYTKIKKTIEIKKFEYLENTYLCKNSFWRSFYELSIENSVADMYDIFGDCSGHFINKYIKTFNDKTGIKYYKMMAFIHLTEYSSKNPLPCIIDGYRYFLEIYRLDKVEERFFSLMLKCFNEFNNEFFPLRSAVFLRYVFGVREESQNVLDFANKFCYNSYIGFFDAFNKFITVDRRIEIAYS